MAKYDDKNWFADLDVSDPPGTEDIALGDNLLRAIARMLKNHFPNVPASDVYTGTLAQLNSIASGEAIPRDTIVAWYGDEGTSPDGPDGWTICDGRPRKDGGGGNAPDLRRQFLIGGQVTGGTELFVGNIGDTGGDSEIDIRDPFTGNLIKFETDDHVLTADEIASHTHPMFTTETTNGDAGTPGVGDKIAVFGDNVGSNRAYKMQPSNFSNATVGQTGAPTGSGAALGHSHKFSIDGSNTFTGANLPPFNTVLWIIKD